MRRTIATVRPVPVDQVVLSRHRGSDAAGVDFVVVDVETTGRDAVSERVIEVAAVRVRDGEVIDEFATLVDPGREIRNTKYHGITTADVDGAPNWTKVAPTLHSYLSGAVMVCHYSVFDHAFLSHEFSRAGIDIGATPTLCTLLAARSQLDLWKWGLGSVVERVTGIRPDFPHTALDDARTTARLLRGFLHDAPEPLRLSAPTAQLRTALPTPGVSTRNRVIANRRDLVHLVEQLPITYRPVDAGAFACYKRALHRAMDGRKIDLEETRELGELIRCDGLVRTAIEQLCRKLLKRHWLDVHDDGNVTWQEAIALNKMALLGGLPEQVAGINLDGDVADVPDLAAGHEPVYRREPILRWAEHWRPYELHVDDCTGRFGLQARLLAVHRARPTPNRERQP